MLIDLIKPIIENPIFIKYGMLGLFFNTVLAGIIPFPTEITSSALLLNGQNPTAVYAIMTIGTVIGGSISYFIGYDGNKLSKLIRRAPKKEHYDRSMVLFNKYGWWIIIASSWIPILGDVITIIAGIKKYNFKKFIVSMVIGKATHAFAIVYISNAIFHFFQYFRI